MKCHACKCHVTPVAPRTTWKIFNLALWTASLIVAVACGSLMGLNLVLAPVAIGIGTSIGTSARRLTAWTCPRCNTELLVPQVGTVLTPSTAH